MRNWIEQNPGKRPPWYPAPTSPPPNRGARVGSTPSPIKTYQDPKPPSGRTGASPASSTQKPSPPGSMSDPASRLIEENITNQLRIEPKPKEYTVDPDVYYGYKERTNTDSLKIESSATGGTKKDQRRKKKTGTGTGTGSGTPNTGGAGGAGNVNL